MKKVPFEVFGEGQYMYFNIARLMQLEQACGEGISKIVSKQELNLTVLTHILVIGLAHHKSAMPCGTRSVSRSYSMTG